PGARPLRSPPGDGGARRDASGARQLSDERGPALVAAVQAQLLRGAPQRHDGRDGLDLLPRNVHRIAREPRCQPPEPAARAPGVAAHDDLADLGRPAVEAGDLEVVDLAAVPPIRVDQLVVEDAERDVDLRGPRHPWPPLVSSIRGMAASAITRIT